MFDGLRRCLNNNLVGFQDIFHFAYRPELHDPMLGQYLMIVGISFCITSDKSE